MPFSQCNVNDRNNTTTSRNEINSVSHTIYFRSKQLNNSYKFYKFEMFYLVKMYGACSPKATSILWLQE